MTWGVFAFLWDSFTLWLNNVFVAPFTNLEILWILVPVYLGLVLAEIFQEKRGTSMGNAISNAVIVLWGGIDFLRIMINNSHNTSLSLNTVAKIIIALAIIAFGIVIIVQGLKARQIVKRIGRVRNVSYFIIIFAPLYYTNVILSWEYLFGAFAFFGIFYALFYAIDRFLPDSDLLLQDIKDTTGTHQGGTRPAVSAPAQQQAQRPQQGGQNAYQAPSNNSGMNRGWP